MSCRILIFLFLVFTARVSGQGRAIEQDTYRFNSGSITINNLQIDGDSLLFKFSADTGEVSIDHVWSQDEALVWVHYKNRGMYDFWEVYCSQFNYEKEDYVLRPKKLISRFFNDKKIHLYQSIIYSAAIKPQKMYDCGGCYNWTNYLFKIKASEYYLLCEKASSDFVVVRNSFTHAKK